MNGNHSVEKIGGTSMTRFHEVMHNVIIGKRMPGEMYNRIFVVSAYSGITDLLLDNKKTGEPGVFERFAESHDDWQDKLDRVRGRMLELNRSFEDIGLDIKKADEFVDQRIEGIRTRLQDLMRVCSFGHLTPETYLPASRELVCGIGEAHSAFNSALILQENGVNIQFVVQRRNAAIAQLALHAAFVENNLTVPLPDSQHAYAVGQPNEETAA